MKDGRDSIYTLLERKTGVNLIQSATECYLRLKSTSMLDIQSNFNIAPIYSTPWNFLSDTMGSLANRSLIMVLCWVSSRLGLPQDMEATDNDI